MARIVRGVLVRALYSLYLGLAAILLVVMHEGRITGGPYWTIIAAVAALLIECIVTNKLTQGFDWKWFSPCTVIFSAAGLFAVWAAQLRSLSFTTEGVHVCLNQTFTEELQNLNTSLVSDWLDFCICGNCNGGAEQLFILMLMLGKYLLPKGVSFYNPNDNINNFLDGLAKTHYFLVVACNGADVMDMISYTRFPGIKGNAAVVSILLILFSIGIIQFNLNTFATLEEKSSHLYIIVETDLWSSLITILTDDFPYMVMRIYLLANYKAFSPFGVFFLVKNIMYMSLTLHKGVLIYTGKDINEIEEYVTSEPYTPQVKRKAISRLEETPDGLDDISDGVSIYSNEIPVKSRNDARKPDMERENTEVEGENIGDWGDQKQWFSDADMKESVLPSGLIPADWDVESQIGSQTTMNRFHKKLSATHQLGYFTEDYAEDKEAEMDVSKVGTRQVLYLPLGKALIGGEIDFSKATPPPPVDDRRGREDSIMSDDEGRSKSKKSKKKKDNKEELNIDQEIDHILDDTSSEKKEKKKKKKKDRGSEDGEEDEDKSKKKKKKKSKSRDEEGGSDEERTEKKQKKKKHKDDDYED